MGLGFPPPRTRYLFSHTGLDSSIQQDCPILGARFHLSLPLEHSLLQYHLFFRVAFPATQSDVPYFLTVLLRLASNFWAQETVLSLPPQELALYRYRALHSALSHFLNTSSYFNSLYSCYYQLIPIIGLWISSLHSCLPSKPHTYHKAGM